MSTDKLKKCQLGKLLNTRTSDFKVEIGQEFNSMSEVERKSKDLFGIKISQKDVSLNCNNKTESAKGYHFIILY